MNRNESAEDYLEVILILEMRKGEVRSIDIANEMGFSKPSISRAMSRLRESGNVVFDPKGFVVLTEAGRKLAEEVYVRHKTLTSFLEKLGVPEDIAADDACRIEHVISPETFEGIQKFLSE